ncbi:hypothetical protein [Aneurinibacillus tyrosinisolvens]
MLTAAFFLIGTLSFLPFIDIYNIYEHYID